MNMNVTTELLDMTPMSGTTTGNGSYICLLGNADETPAVLTVNVRLIAKLQV